MKKLGAQALLDHVEQAQLKDNVPDFKAGDTIVVHLRVTENKKTRIQKFEGAVISRRGHGLTENFIVRKETAGVGVEKILYVHSPNVTRIDLLKRGKVRRARIYYMRERKGKAARIAVAQERQ